MDGDCIGGGVDRGRDRKMVPEEGGEEGKNGRKILTRGNERGGSVRARENIYGYSGGKGRREKGCK